MKKIAILLVFTLGTFIVNAQSVVEGTKFMDNWSVGVNAGAVTPLTHAYRPIVHKLCSFYN
jgi:hypothetical protein